MLAISTDSIYAHKVFTEVSPSAARVRYPMLSDRSGRMVWSYGAYDPEGGTARRVTVLVDPDGKISFWMAYPIEVGRSAPEILRTVMGVQYSRHTGQGVPANWLPSEPGIERDFGRVGTI